ncbi:FAD/NAD(P)-binding protein [Actinoplanes sp. NPDC023714]|uniref:FAD/NAD(P)-binding protein n=1 Tax=Actinoplanes sp. NPDC023714 TaxID=3154322 RepID=UPI0033E493A6
MTNATDLGDYVAAAAARGDLVVQPRMGLSRPDRMAAGLRAVAAADATTLATITLDSYTRVNDHAAARRALESGVPLNGFPLVAHGPHVAARVVRAAGDRTPVQVRHGSADPGRIFDTMLRAGLAASEGGPVSYCLPYGRVPLTASVAHWSQATTDLAGRSRDAGLRAHLETFGGCLLGQLCPPSLLVALSVLEALFFAQHGIGSVSLSYAQQTHPVQDLEALAALRALAGRLLPPEIDRHLVVYTYMGVFPGTEPGARRLLDTSAELAVRGGAQRLIVKTAAEAHRIPTVAENVAALEAAGRRATLARAHSDLPWAESLDYSAIHDEATALIEAVLGLSDDVGVALRRAFAAGLLDVPFCLHPDNAGRTQGMIGADGRLNWADTGRLPLRRATTAPAGRVTSRRLLTMLSHTANRHDRVLAPVGPTLPVPAPGSPAPYRIAVVGTGPRGIAVLERLVARLTAHPPDRPVILHAIDAVQVGCGQIWRTDQPGWFLMNTPAGEVTMFSGPADGGRPRAGAGPSLAEWWRTAEPGVADPNGYAPRRTYGRYLTWVLDTIEAGLPPAVTLHRVHARVRTLDTAGTGPLRLETADGRILVVDRVVLSTGHPAPQLSGGQQAFADVGVRHPGARYLRATHPAAMPLDELPAGRPVGVLGLGLTFYDVMAALTIGRGGRFVGTGDSLRYQPSGAEPLLVAGSRSGVPLPARGRNQKPGDFRYTPRIFTPQRIHAARATGPLDFRGDVQPWLLAEIDLVYFGTAIRQRFGPEREQEFTERVLAALARGAGPDAVLLAARGAGLTDLPVLDLAALARPFTGRRFASPRAFHRIVRRHLGQDLAAADQGNVDGPRKAALDTLRDVRSVIRAAVDHGGLTARSHRDDFLGAFVPLASTLSAGPPRLRLQQVIALLDAGVLRLLGPGAVFTADSARGRFRGSSPQVRGSATALDALVDARIPAPDLRRDPAPLTRHLVGAGVLHPYANGTFRTGGVHVTTAPYHPVGAGGRPDRRLHVLGIPTEHTRWFTQVGSGRPGRWDTFTTDADTIAANLLGMGKR